MVQWLRLHTSTAGGTGSIPGWGTKIPHAERCSQNKIKFTLSCITISMYKMSMGWLLKEICFTLWGIGSGWRVRGFPMDSLPVPVSSMSRGWLNQKLSPT